MKENFQNSDEEFRYKTAEKKVKEIKSFYIHLVVYIAINTLIIFYNSNNHFFGSGSMNISFGSFSTAFFWGIGLFCHWASVFGPGLLLGKNWEERKIKELMDKEKTNKQKWE